MSVGTDITHRLSSSFEKSVPGRSHGYENGMVVPAGRERLCGVV